MGKIRHGDLDCRSRRAVLHPLDPLSADEIRAAVAVVRASDRLGRQVLFIRVSLHEPPKSTVLTFRTGDALEPTGFFVGSPALDVPATSHNGRDGGHCH